MCQYRFHSGLKKKKVPFWWAMLKMGKLCMCQAGDSVETSTPSSQFYCKPKIALKNKVFQKNTY